MMNKLIKLAALLIAFNTYADDTDIYTALDSGVEATKRAVFLMDTSGSMAINADCSVSPCKTRMDVVQEVARDVISDPQFDDLEIALMRFDSISNNGGYLLTEFLSLDNDTTQQRLINEINALPTSGGTPLKESISEAVRFLRGDTSLYSKFPDPSVGCSSFANVFSDSQRIWLPGCFTLRSGATCTRLELAFISGIGWRNDVCTDWIPMPTNERSTPSTFAAPGVYKTAFKQTCDAPHIIAFTDGESSADTNEDATILANYNNLVNAGVTPTLAINNQNDPQHHQKLAFWINNTDHSSSLNNEQNIILNTIGGFNSNLNTLLENMAKQGGGSFGSGDDFNSLKTALGDAINNVLENGSTFVSPQVAVSTDNTLEVGNDVYVSVFKPTKGAAWSGNVKRYARDSSGFIIDKARKRIFDSNTGFFSDKSHSFWSEEVDGNDIEAGGIASRIKDRTLYTTSTDNSSIVLFDSANVKQREFKSSSSLSSLSNYLKNKDSEGNELKAIADPLHSRPLVVNYASGERTLFITTNAGFLHAFNPSLENPGERYAFIPRDLLPSAAAYHDEGPSKIYGLDLTPYLWHKDTNGNLKVDSNEKAYLYLGMRRGGRDYYVVDISDPNKPVMVDHIQGGAGEFANLGQTWALPLRARIKWRDANGSSKDVLVISGGYDTAPDTSRTTLEGSHSIGKDVYIIDPETNSVLWQASDVLKLDHAIPNRPTLIDDNRDGFHDTMYLTDLAGKILRFDFNPEATSKSNFAKGGIIADLAVSSGITRFFSRPDIAYVNYGITLSDSTELYEPRYQLAIGSGNRAIPNGKNIQNHFFVLYDFLAKSNLGVTWDNINYTNTCIPSDKTQLEKNEADGSYKIHTVCRSDLAKSTVSANADGFTNFQINRQGFYFELPDAGEKVLARGITLNNNITFSSFQPRSSNASTCSPSGGQTRRFTLLLDGNFTLTSQDQSINSIEDELEIVIREPQEPTSPDGAQIPGAVEVSQEGGLNGGESLGGDSIRPYGVLRWEVQ